MTRAETEPMPRLLLALCLYAVAAVALAGSPAAADEAATKPVKPAATSATNDSDGSAPAPVSPAPSRAGTATRAITAPRWHSMLPGMIR
jgi:hypothetical protein